jgi:hypothetical protein
MTMSLDNPFLAKKDDRWKDVSTETMMKTMSLDNPFPSKKKSDPWKDVSTETMMMLPPVAMIEICKNRNENKPFVHQFFSDLQATFQRYEDNKENKTYYPPQTGKIGHDRFFVVPTPNKHKRRRTTEAVDEFVKPIMALGLAIDFSAVTNYPTPSPPQERFTRVEFLPLHDDEKLMDIDDNDNEENLKAVKAEEETFVDIWAFASSRHNEQWQCGACSCFNKHADTHCLACSVKK